MKTRSLICHGLVISLCLAAWTAGPRASAQTATNLHIQLYAGLTITGTVGAVYSVEYLAALGGPNANEWRGLEFVQLPTSPYLWTDKSGPAIGERFYRAVQFDAPTNLVFIPPGTFRMGSPPNEVDRDGEEGPQTEVTISRGFWMSRCETTQGEYLTVTGNNPSYFEGDLDRPVEWVIWQDATNFCRLSTSTERAARRLPAGYEYRLPTSAEWEYACRAWTSTRFSYGDDPGYTNLNNYAWYDYKGAVTTHPVGKKLPNPWGLYDMHGNVYEWCEDWHPNSLPGGRVTDPRGPKTGLYHVFRGGAWNSIARRCRSAYYYGYPLFEASAFGFRVVLAPERH